MSGEELVSKFVVAGRNIFAQTNVAAELQVDILAGIAWIVGKKLGDHELRGRLERPSGRTDRGTFTRAAIDGNVEATGTNARSVSGTAPVAEALAVMKLKERRAFLDRHYQGRTPWAEARPKRPQESMPADFLQWANTNFPDRRQLRLVLSDLATLDREAYGKLRHWANRKGNAAKIDPADFGFPSKVVRYDPTKPVPTGAELFKAIERGDPRAPELRRDYMRARYHLQRDS
jgi:hypothetical protein